MLGEAKPCLSSLDIVATDSTYSLGRYPNVGHRDSLRHFPYELFLSGPAEVNTDLGGLKNVEYKLSKRPRMCVRDDHVGCIFNH